VTEVQFHFNVPDRLGYACRLLRKALRTTDGVAVSAPAATLARLDRELWTFDPLAFVPHLLLRAGQKPAERLHATPVWLVERPEDAAQHPVLVHLGDEAALGFESFERLIEIVSGDPAERDAARARWRHYASRGYDIKRHDVST
jgi:DNA polymerase-3 subunit chi